MLRGGVKEGRRGRQEEYQRERRRNEKLGRGVEKRKKGEEI